MTTLYFLPVLLVAILLVRMAAEDASYLAAVEPDQEPIE